MSSVRGIAELDLKSDKFVQSANQAKQSLSQLGTEGKTSMTQLGQGADQAAISVKKTAAELNAAKAATVGLVGSVAGLSTSFVGLYTSVSSLNKGLINIERAEVALQRANDLLATTTATINRLEFQKKQLLEKGEANTEKMALLEEKLRIQRQKLITATDDLEVKQADLSQKQDEYNDTVTLFATSVATTAITAFSSLFIMMSTAATAAGVTTGAFIKQQFALAGLNIKYFGAAASARIFGVSQIALNATMGKWLLIATAAILAYEGIAHAIKFFNKDIDITIEKLGGDLINNLIGTNEAFAENTETMEQAETQIQTTTEAMEMLNETFDPEGVESVSNFGSAVGGVAGPSGPMQSFLDGLIAMRKEGNQFIHIYSDAEKTIIPFGKTLGVFADKAQEAAKELENLKKNYDNAVRSIIVNPDLAKFTDNPDVEDFLDFIAIKKPPTVNQVIGLTVVSAASAVGRTTSRFAGRTLTRAIKPRSSKHGGANVVRQRRIMQKAKELGKKFGFLGFSTRDIMRAITGRSSIPGHKGPGRFRSFLSQELVNKFVQSATERVILLRQLSELGVAAAPTLDAETLRNILSETESTLSQFTTAFELSINDIKKISQQVGFENLEPQLRFLRRKEFFGPQGIDISSFGGMPLDELIRDDRTLRDLNNMLAFMNRPRYQVVKI